MNNLLEAVKNGDLKTAQALIEASADLDSKDDNWETALLLASVSGHTEIVKALIEAGVNAQDIGGKTALELASVNGHTEIVKLLKEVGAKE